jgi:hypothetical protein
VYLLDAGDPIQLGWGFPTFAATLVEITTDDGLTGIGEAIVRKAPQVTRTVVEQLLAPVLLGRDPHDVEGLWDEMFQQLRGWGHWRGFVFEAMSGWTPCGISWARPGCRSRSSAAGRPRRATPPRCTCRDWQMVARRRSRLGAYRAQGRRSAEAGVGGATTPRQRSATPSGRGDIMLDVNSAYDAATAVRCRSWRPRTS